MLLSSLELLQDFLNLKYHKLQPQIYIVWFFTSPSSGFFCLSQGRGALSCECGVPLVSVVCTDALSMSCECGTLSCECVSVWSLYSALMPSVCPVNVVPCPVNVVPCPVNVVPLVSVEPICCTDALSVSCECGALSCECGALSSECGSSGSYDLSVTGYWYF